MGISVDCYIASLHYNLVGDVVGKSVGYVVCGSNARNWWFKASVSSNKDLPARLSDLQRQEARARTQKQELQTTRKAEILTTSNRFTENIMLLSHVVKSSVVLT
jgi:hypothetical protein